MKFISNKFNGLILISHEVISDNRGYFKESFRKNNLEKFLDYELKFCQKNVVSSRLNVLRGLHFQKQPFAQSKLVSVTEGKILDIVVDIRPKSTTYGQYCKFILSSKNHESLFIPKGFAHGYLTLSKKAVVNYLVDNYYNSEMEEGISFKDSFLKIDWGIDQKDLIISEKDSNLKDYKWQL